MNRSSLALPLVAALVGAACLVVAPAQAGTHVDVGIGLRFDSRYHHDHYYPAPGYVVAHAPPGAVVVRHPADPYYFHGGVWYHGYGPRLRVVVPPVGILVPLLPSAYVTLRIGGAPYFYANGVYYQSAPGGYVVVNPPAEAPEAVPAPPPPPLRPEPIIYPRNGQSTQQTEADRQDCNRWAASQPAALNDASVFNRAVEACMDGRGYSMR